MKVRSSTKIAVGFIAVLALGFFGFRLVVDSLMSRQTYPPVEPGTVNLLGVDTRAGYSIVVSNQVAQLVRGGSGNFERPEAIENVNDPDKKRVPIRELLRSLQGDEVALGRFVMVLNDLSEADLPAYPVVWKAEDLQKALDGDAALADKLSKDISVDLDGNPRPEARITALEEGIVIESPVQVRVPVGNEVRTLVGRIREPFRSQFAKAVHEEYRERANVNNDMIAGFYKSLAQEIQRGETPRENVRQALSERIGASRLQAFAEIPEKILNSVTVIVNDGHMRGARSRDVEGGDGKKYQDMLIALTDEGRQRLWRYSRDKVGSQLLMVWDGIAIAAPRINHEILESEVTITQLRDKGLVQDTIAAINQKAN